MLTRSEKQIAAKTEKIRKLYQEINDIKGKMGKCTHAFYHPYSWEHDNGYGRQSMHKGRRCSTCGAVDLWNDGGWVTQEDIRRGY